MLASVIIITYNHGKYLSNCIQSLLKQSYENLEIIVVDDASKDNTQKIVESFSSKKIKYFQLKQHQGVALSRNFGIKKALGEFVFFTDADCEPLKNWVQEGITCFLENNCDAVEGKTIAENQNFSISYHFVENLNGGQYQTCNMAYKRNSLLKVGMFNAKYSLAYEDIDLALRIKKENTIIFCKDMIVLHKLVPWNTKHLFLNARRAKYKVLLVKEHNYREILTFGILEINDLFKLLFPFLIPFYYKIRTLNDILILPVFYARVVMHRFIIWKTAIQEKYFIL